MEQSMDTVGESPGGLSRRDMIKASVAAGALVWSAPVLLTGTAAAAVTLPCPCNGTLIVVKIASTTSVNCGVSCEDKRFGTNIDCNAVGFLLNCIFTQSNCTKSGGGMTPCLTVPS